MAIIPNEPIKYHSDFQTQWSRVLKPLPNNKFKIKQASMLSIHGDAPKGFLQLRELPPSVIAKGRRRARISGRPSRWPAYIAKVGSKWYPIESVTEHMLTRIGQIAGMRMADSQLRIVGSQVRFLSRFFLKKSEILYHGYDLFSDHLGEDLAQQISGSKEEPHLYTFQTIGEAVLDRFHEQYNSIMGDLAELIAFDALVGNNDRHAANWGIVVELTGAKAPRFSPIFDTARALFWNNSEDKISKTLNNPATLNRYINNTYPLIGWDGEGAVSHFGLLRGIASEYPEYCQGFSRLSEADFLKEVHKMLYVEFSDLVSPERLELVVRCLQERQTIFRETLAGTEGL